MPTTVADTVSRAADVLADGLESHRRRLWGLAYRLTGSTQDADDVVQETFARWIEHAADNAPPSQLQIGQQIISNIEHFSAELQQNIEHFSTELQQIVAGDLSNLAGAHDNTARGPLFDLLHGFIIH